MTKCFMGDLCPNCRQFPRFGALSDLPFEDDKIEIICQHCGWVLRITRQWVPQLTILGDAPEEKLNLDKKSKL